MKSYTRSLSSTVRMIICAAHLLMLFLISGCGPPRAEIEFMNMVQQTMKNHDAFVVRAAVLPLMYRLDPKVVPKEIADIPLFQHARDNIMVAGVSNEKGEIRGLIFLTGSGFGHWGIVVCPYEDGPAAVKRLHGKVVSWTNSVYFYLER